ncbi:unnamed protein product [Prorocentrum cordatum]|uniref:CobW/HypB/UreG nucleotide-binding domain-containing protein n=1 Tax=Prorocentrum cordatum TaxID=2364126 RepID=A0ABN9VZA5_9DINO|nr:unnamed protein product [Polarella glacialis]
MIHRRIRKTFSARPGTGKTTLLKHWLEKAEGRIGVIVNDVAAVNIDSKLVKEQKTSAAGKVETVELQNGCACCSLGDELVLAVSRMMRLADAGGSPFDYIIVELSGVAEPQRVEDMFKDPAMAGLLQGCQLSKVVTVVDSSTFCQNYMDYQVMLERPDLVDVGGNELELAGLKVVELLVEQIEAADAVVLNKTDLAAAGDLAATREVVSALRDVPLFETSFGKLGLAEVVSAPAAAAPAEAAGDFHGHGGHAHHAVEGHADGGHAHGKGHDSHAHGRTFAGCASQLPAAADKERVGLLKNFDGFRRMSLHASTMSQGFLQILGYNKHFVEAWSTFSEWSNDEQCSRLFQQQRMRCRGRPLQLAQEKAPPEKAPRQPRQPRSADQVLMKSAKENFDKLMKLTGRADTTEQMVKDNLDHWGWAAEDGDFKELQQQVNVLNEKKLSKTLALATRLQDIAKVKKELEATDFQDLLVTLSGLSSSLKSVGSLLDALEDMHALKTRRRLGLSGEAKPKPKGKGKAVARALGIHAHPSDNHADGCSMLLQGPSQWLAAMQMVGRPAPGPPPARGPPFTVLDMVEAMRPRPSGSAAFFRQLDRAVRRQITGGRPGDAAALVPVQPAQLVQPAQPVVRAGCAVAPRGVVTRDMVVARMNNCSRDQLLDAIVRLTNQNHGHRANARAAAKQRRKDAATIARQKDAIELQTAKLRSFALVREFKRTKVSDEERVRFYLTTEGRYRLGIKRNFGFASASTTRQMLEGGPGVVEGGPIPSPLSRAVTDWLPTVSASCLEEVPASVRAVCESEHLSRAYYFARAKKWYEFAYLQLDDFCEALSSGVLQLAEENPIISWGAHSMRGDAARSSDWKSRTLFCSDVWSAFCIPVTLADGSPGFDARANFCHPDMAWVPRSSTGLALMKMREGKLEHAGTCTWRSFLNVRLQMQQLGPDELPPAEALGDTMIGMSVQQAGELWKHITIFIGGTDKGPDCCGMGRHLRHDLAELLWVWWIQTYCWIHQLHLIAKDQLKRMTGYYSRIAKMANSRRSPGKAPLVYLTWKNMFGGERARHAAGRLPPRPLVGRFGAIYKTGEHFLRCGMRETQEVYKRVFAPREFHESDIQEDPDGESWAAKMGRWEADAVAATHCVRHWIDMYVLHIPGQPVIRMLHWLEKRGAFLRADRDKTFQFHSGSTAQVAVNFYRRFALELKLFPYTLLWMAFKPAGEECQRRVHCAQSLLGRLGDPEMEGTTEWKIAKCSECELRAVARRGVIDAQAWRLFLALSHMISSDTQEIEGMNGIVKSVLSMAPNAGLELLSTRTLLKKSLATMSRSPAGLDNAIKDCVDNHRSNVKTPTSKCAATYTVMGVPQRSWLICHLFRRGFWAVNGDLGPDEFKTKLPLEPTSLKDLCEQIHRWLQQDRVNHACKLGVAPLARSFNSLQRAARDGHLVAKDVRDCCECPGETTDPGGEGEEGADAICAEDEIAQMELDEEQALALARDAHIKRKDAPDLMHLAGGLGEKLDDFTLVHDLKRQEDEALLQAALDLEIDPCIPASPVPDVATKSLIEEFMIS